MEKKGIYAKFLAYFEKKEGGEVGEKSIE